MVYILGLNGSPRTYGNTYKLLKIALEAAEKLGAATEIINLYEYDIKDCIGCLSDEPLACRYPCVIDDDMKEIYDKILKADGVIFATPIYWYSPSGVIKRVIDRLTALENMIFVSGRSWVEGKVAGVIAVGNDSGEIQLISLMYATLNSMGFIIPPFALSFFNTREDVLSDDETLLEAANVGRSITLMAKLVSGFKDVWFDTELKEWILRVKDEVRKVAEKNKEKVFRERKRIITKLMRE
ncbi:MAG: flavodoxin family protein [Thermoprotei archaeon]|nr:MAG: flavodoxin family protein [Thermoprotei archaeon]